MHKHHLLPLLKISIFRRNQFEQQIGYSRARSASPLRCVRRTDLCAAELRILIRVILLLFAICLLSTNAR